LCIGAQTGWLKRQMLIALCFTMHGCIFFSFEKTAVYVRETHLDTCRCIHIATSQLRKTSRYACDIVVVHIGILIVIVGVANQRALEQGCELGRQDDGIDTQIPSSLKTAPYISSTQALPNPLLYITRALCKTHYYARKPAQKSLEPATHHYNIYNASHAILDQSSTSSYTANSKLSRESPHTPPKKNQTKVKQRRYQKKKMGSSTSSDRPARMRSST
jgi:hypothetical protein